ncbi:MAG: DUF502 domain-containing protein [Gammaproteobacteria bacterium]|nr:DUF502 domain-containing protein [Gammaproteobacteria bacterium]
MFRSIGKTLLVGFITILPIVLTLYLLYWLATTSEQVLGNAIQWLLPDIFYFPGQGIVAGLLLIFLVGLLMKMLLVRRLFSYAEKIFFSLPLVKTVYGAIRDLFDFFSPKKQGLGQVVIVNFNDIELIGFVTEENTARLPQPFSNGSRVPVYVPMSYMVGGFTLMIEPSQLKPCDMPVDQAMRFAMTAGITGREN